MQVHYKQKPYHAYAQASRDRVAEVMFYIEISVQKIFKYAIKVNLEYS